MKKYFVAIITVFLLCLLSISLGCDFFEPKTPGTETLNNPRKSDAKLFINDELQLFAIYRNDKFFNSDIKEFVPLQACIEALGCTYEKKGSTFIIITTPDDRKIEMNVGAKTISYTGGLRNVSRAPMEYMEIDGKIYYPLHEFPELVDCELVFDGKDLYLDTGEYLKKDHGYDSVGRKLHINVYVNDIKIETPVYYNRKSPSVQGPDNCSDYVMLKPILEVLGIDISATTGWHYLLGESVVIDGESYVPFSSIRYNINGDLVQDDYSSMYLYSSDYVRNDIPATLEEAYRALDKLLTPKDIQYIKNLKEDEVVLLHFGLGLWIRNNWLYPTNSRLADLLFKAGIEHPDDMSTFILLGYHHYLNGEKYTFDMYKQSMK